MHPILFNAGPVTIYSYGVLLASAYLLGLWLAVKRARAAVTAVVVEELAVQNLDEAEQSADASPVAGGAVAGEAAVPYLGRTAGGVEAEIGRAHV